MIHKAHVFKSINADRPYYAFSIQERDESDLLVSNEYVFKDRYQTQAQAQEAATAEIMRREQEARRA